MPFYVYILYSVSADKYYVGHTDNLERRLLEHITGQTRFSSGLAKDWELKYTEEFDTRALAMQREKAIKDRKSRRYIEGLIRGSSVG